MRQSRTVDRRGRRGLAFADGRGAAVSMENQGATRTVLLVEDDERLLAAYKTAVERAPNVRALTASNIEAARQLASLHRPQIYIIDMQLGCESGIDLILELSHKAPGARFVLVSGYTSTESTVAAMRAGAFDVISKPVSAAEIMARVVGEPDVADSPAGSPPETPSAERALWEHMHRVLGDCRGNRSKAARRLGVDRSTLQRWLRRRAPSR